MGSRRPELAVPAEPPPILSGPSAHDWEVQQLRWRLFAALGLPFIALATILSQPMRTVVIVAAVTVVVVCGVRAGRASISKMRAEAREKAAGYTTLDAKRYRHLW